MAMSLVPYMRSSQKLEVNHGTVPNDALYFTLKPQSTNRGEVDQGRLLAGLPQTASTNPHGSYQLFRVGDAASGRNTHAAIYDALRLVTDL
jgi:hypothetical protein